MQAVPGYSPLEVLNTATAPRHDGEVEESWPKLDIATFYIATS
jgi:hypothetical protein